MKLYFNPILIISIIFFGFQSCKKTETLPISDDILNGDNIKIRMSEIVDSTNRTLLLHCFTEKVYECANYGIQATHTLTKDKITINFIKIIAPNICLTSFAPAATSIKFDELESKNYEIEFNFGSTKIAGQLNVSTGSFRAMLPAQMKVQFVNPDIRRVPNNTIYGTIGYHSTSTVATVQSFIDALQLCGAVPALYSQGDYGQFQIESNGQIKQTQNLGYYFTRHFIFNYSGNSAQLKNVVRQFGVNYPDALTITLNTTKGEIFYSWKP